MEICFHKTDGKIQPPCGYIKHYYLDVHSMRVSAISAIFTHLKQTIVDY